MSFLKGNKADKPEYTGLQLQTSASVLPVPIVWGVNKISHNVVFWDNFQSHQSGSKTGKGGAVSGGGGSKAMITTYTVDLALALCEGPINGVGWVWDGQAISSPYALDFFVFNGTNPQSTWGYFSALYPTFLLNFPSTAIAVGASVPLGAANALPNITWEIIGILAGTGANGYDADPALVIYDFLTSLQYGVGFDPTLIDYTSLVGPSGGNSVSAYCQATGISFSPTLTSQEQGSTILTRWLQIINCNAVWSGNILRFIPYGDEAIAPGLTKVTTAPLTIPPEPELGWQVGGGTGLTQTALGWTWLVIIPPGGALNVISISYATNYYQIQMVNAGAAGPFILAADTPGFYFVVGNTIYFSKADANQAIVVTYSYTTAGSFTPDLTPIYSLGDDDYADDGGEDKDPIIATRVDPFSLYTIMRLDCSSRTNRYSPIPVEVRDQGQIDVYGPRIATNIQAHEICDELNVGPISAQLILNRQLYIRAHFKFKLSWEYCLLDPMDIIAISDSVLGLDNFLVRIVSIDEDDHGVLDIEAEELLQGTSSTPLYAGATTVTPPLNTGQTTGAINPPLIYEPPSGYSSTPEVLLGASSSGPSGIADPNYGGCNVWASLDGTTYTEIGTILGALSQGYLTAYYASASGWDTTDVLSVDLTESGGTLAGTSAAAAQGGLTLCLIDDELVAFETATLTASHRYDLTNIQRGLYGTTPAAHSTGAAFYRLDPAVTLTEILPPQWIGVYIYLKFQSFNIFGAGTQDLATCAVYVLNATGSSVSHPIATQLLTGVPLDLGSVTAGASTSDDFDAVYADPVTGIVDLGILTSTSGPIIIQLIAALPSGSVDLGLVTSAVTVSDSFGSVIDIPPRDTVDLGTAP